MCLLSVKLCFQNVTPQLLYLKKVVLAYFTINSASLGLAHRFKFSIPSEISFITALAFSSWNKKTMIINIICSVQYKITHTPEEMASLFFMISSVLDEITSYVKSSAKENGSFEPFYNDYLCSYQNLRECCDGERQLSWCTFRPPWPGPWTSCQSCWPLPRAFGSASLPQRGHWISGGNIPRPSVDVKCFLQTLDFRNVTSDTLTSFVILNLPSSLRSDSKYLASWHWSLMKSWSFSAPKDRNTNHIFRARNFRFRPNPQCWKKRNNDGRCTIKNTYT